jgi:hypothetical protein
MQTEARLDQEVGSLFARCPELCGFSVRGEKNDLFVADVGIAPRLSAEQYGEIFHDIARTLAELLDDDPDTLDLIRGRTFARALQ